MEAQQSSQGQVLVIDDDQAIRESIRTGLSAGTYHFKVETAHDAESGFAAARRNKPDVIILDLNMPLVNGFTFMDRLRADGELRGIRVLMLTANASTANEWESIDRDVDDFLGKPFDLEELEIRVKSLMNKTEGTSRRI